MEFRRVLFRSAFDADRNLLQIVPVNVATEFGIVEKNGFVKIGNVQNTLPSDALILSICSPLSSSPLYPGYGGGFVFFNTHSLPVRWDDMFLCVPWFLGPISVGLPALALPMRPGRTFDPI